MSINAITCKTFRTEARLTQAELAKAAGISPKTISDFEKGKTTPQNKTLAAIRAVLEQAGAISSPNKPKAGGGGLWVTASDLSNWADTQSKKMQNLLPEIVRRLLRAIPPNQIEINAPAGDSTYVEGWDVIVQASSGNQYIPLGQSGWEVGCDKGITGKANKDYKKRKEDPLSLDPNSTTFVFVSPRRWKGKASWIADRSKEAFWDDIRALDADDLEQWLMQAPHVAIWLAKEMGKYTSGVEHIHEFWDCWKKRTEPHLNSSVILAGRTKARDENIYDWLQSPSGILAVQGETDDEALAFLAAALETLKKESKQSDFQRCLITHNKEAYRSLVGEPTPMIIVIPDSIRELAGAATKLGHHVFIPLGKDSEIPQQNGFQLPLLDRDAFVKALMEINYEQAEAEELCKETGRSLPVLQRRTGTSRNPVWAKPIQAQNLIPALLVGAWDESNKNDKEILSRLADATYPELDQKFTQWANESDAPLRHIGSQWRHTSRLDSWRLLAPYITKSHIETLAEVIPKVLGARDPRVDTPPQDRWYVTDRIPYSDVLREGLLQTLILLATKSGDVDFKATQNPEEWVEWQITDLLRNASQERWYSLSSLLPMISEAAPRAFLNAVEDSLNQTQPSIMKLFESGNSGFGGDGSVHAGLLWALENLAWDPQYLTSTTDILGILCQLDPDPDSNYINRPANSLKEIFLLWPSHTHANLKQRMEAIDYLIKHVPHAAWKLLLSILPGSRDISRNTHKMRWRAISVPPLPPVTKYDVIEGAREITLRIQGLAKSSIPRSCDLLKKYEYLPGDSQQEIVTNLAKQIENGLPPEDNKSLSGVLRSIISRHRQFPEAKWSMSEDKIAPLAGLYESLLPSDPIERHLWLFDDHWITLMDGTHRNEDEAINNARYKALQNIIDVHGTDGLITLSEKCKEPGIVGLSVANLLPASEQDWPLLIHWLKGEHPVTLAGRNFVSVREHSDGDSWVDIAIRELTLVTKNVAPLVHFFEGLPQNLATWKRLESQLPEIQKYYWENTPFYYLQKDKADMVYAVGKLLKHGRPDSAFQCCRFEFKLLPPRMLIDLLDQLTNTSENNDWRLEGYDVDNAFEALDAATDISEDDVARIEWRYAQALNRHGEGRGTKALHKQMATNPEAFVEMLKLTYKHEDSNVDHKEKEGQDQEVIKKLARNAFHILDAMHLIAGTRTDGSIDQEALRNWLQVTRNLAIVAGRRKVCDLTIGQVFAHAPKEDEETWPAYAICEAIEETRSRDLERGFCTGIYNKRGTVSKAYNEGGQQEYKLASQFRKYAHALDGKYPRVAGVLHEIAKWYEGEARSEDTEATARDLMC